MQEEAAALIAGLVFADDAAPGPLLEAFERRSQQALSASCEAPAKGLTYEVLRM